MASVFQRIPSYSLALSGKMTMYPTVFCICPECDIVKVWLTLVEQDNELSPTCWSFESHSLSNLGFGVFVSVFGTLTVGGTVVAFAEETTGSCFQDPLLFYILPVASYISCVGTAQLHWWSKWNACSLVHHSRNTKTWWYSLIPCFCYIHHPRRMGYGESHSFNFYVCGSNA